MSSEMQPFVLEPGGGSGVRNPVGGRIVFKLRGEQSNGAMTVVETEAAREEGPPLHMHPRHDEWVYVLRGTTRFRLGDDVSPGPAGTFVHIPRGTQHTWQNVGPEPAALLAVITPAGFEDFFERYAELPAEAANLDSFRTIAQETGSIVVGPPLAQSHPTRAATGS